jgi:hypothetical protein
MYSVRLLSRDERMIQRFMEPVKWLSQKLRTHMTIDKPTSLFHLSGGNLDWGIQLNMWKRSRVTRYVTLLADNAVSHPP